jgi:hypothetical protein
MGSLMSGACGGMWAMGAFSTLAIVVGILGAVAIFYYLATLRSANTTRD